MRISDWSSDVCSSDLPLMHRLVPALVGEMGQAYPELLRGQALIAEVLEREEAQFRRTLEKGLRLLDEATADMGAGGELEGEIAFRLDDTYGFPYGLTADALRSPGSAVNRSEARRVGKKCVSTCQDRW